MQTGHGISVSRTSRSSKSGSEHSADSSMDISSASSSYSYEGSDHAEDEGVEIVMHEEESPPSLADHHHLRSSDSNPFQLPPQLTPQHHHRSGHHHQHAGVTKREMREVVYAGNVFIDDILNRVRYDPKFPCDRLTAVVHASTAACSQSMLCSSYTWHLECKYGDASSGAGGRCKYVHDPKMRLVPFTKSGDEGSNSVFAVRGGHLPNPLIRIKMRDFLLSSAEVNNNNTSGTIMFIEFDNRVVWMRNGGGFSKRLWEYFESRLTENRKLHAQVSDALALEMKAGNLFHKIVPGSGPLQLLSQKAGDISLWIHIGSYLQVTDFKRLLRAISHSTRTPQLCSPEFYRDVIKVFWGAIVKQEETSNQRFLFSRLVKSCLVASRILYCSSILLLGSNTNSFFIFNSNNSGSSSGPSSSSRRSSNPASNVIEQCEYQWKLTDNAGFDKYMSTRIVRMFNNGNSRTGSITVHTTSQSSALYNLLLSWKHWRETCNSSSSINSGSNNNSSPNSPLPQTTQSRRMRGPSYDSPASPGGGGTASPSTRPRKHNSKRRNSGKRIHKEEFSPRRTEAAAAAADNSPRSSSSAVMSTTAAPYMFAEDESSYVLGKSISVATASNDSVMEIVDIQSNNSLISVLTSRNDLYIYRSSDLVKVAGVQSVGLAPNAGLMPVAVSLPRSSRISKAGSGKTKKYTHSSSGGNATAGSYIVHSHCTGRNKAQIVIRDLYESNLPVVQRFDVDSDNANYITSLSAIDDRKAYAVLSTGRLVTADLEYGKLVNDSMAMSGNLVGGSNTTVDDTSGRRVLIEPSMYLCNGVYCLTKPLSSAEYMMRFIDDRSSSQLGTSSAIDIPVKFSGIANGFSGGPVPFHMAVVPFSRGAIGEALIVTGNNTVSLFDVRKSMSPVSSVRIGQSTSCITDISVNIQNMTLTAFSVSDRLLVPVGLLANNTQQQQPRTTVQFVIDIQCDLSLLGQNNVVNSNASNNSDSTAASNVLNSFVQVTAAAKYIEGDSDQGSNGASSSSSSYSFDCQQSSATCIFAIRKCKRRINGPAAAAVVTESGYESILCTL